MERELAQKIVSENAVFVSPDGHEPVEAVAQRVLDRMHDEVASLPEFSQERRYLMQRIMGYGPQSAEEIEQAVRNERRSLAEHHGYKVQQKADGGWELLLPVMEGEGKLDCRDEDDGYEMACQLIVPSISYQAKKRKGASFGM